MQLLLLWGCLVLPGYGALVGPKEISGFEGDTVSLQCSYGEELRDHRKYWCRRGGLLISRCSGTIYARQDSQETTEGRVSIRDSAQELRLTVTLRNLTLQDAGTYWCGVIKLGLDETLLVSLLVFPGPCCPPSPTPSFQPLATTSLQPRAKAWHTQPPELTSPGLHPRVTTAKQGKTGAEASPSTGLSLSVHAGTSLYTGTSPAGTSPDAATSPHAGISYPATQLHSTLAKGTGPSRSSSKPRVSIPTVRILAPVLVLLALLLATVLAALGSHVLRRKKEVQLAAETEKNKKVDFSRLPPGNSWAPEYAVVNLAGTAGPTGPQVSPESPVNPYTEIQSLSQTLEEEEAPCQDPQGDRIMEPPADVRGEELGFPKSTSV